MAAAGQSDQWFVALQPIPHVSGATGRNTNNCSNSNRGNSCSSCAENLRLNLAETEVSSKMSVVSRRSVGFACWVLSLVLSIAWLIEALTIGRGFISTYLAPFAIVGNVVGVV